MKGAITRFALISSLLAANWGSASIVTSTTDSGPGSLREAIANAAPGDTIAFSVTGTISLTSSELLVSKNLNIIGPGAANLTIERNAAAPDFRVLDIDSGIVTISGLTFKHGRLTFGGGI